MLIHWIVIYPMESAIQLLNNWALPVSDGTCKSQKTLLSLRGKEYDKLRLVGTQKRVGSAQMFQEILTFLSKR